MTDAERIARIEDREAIRDLLATYCYRVAAGDVDGVVALFAVDCVVEVLGQRYEGEPGLRALYADSLPVEPKPFLHNLLLESLEAESASGRAVFEIRQVRDGRPETSVGCYADRYVKQAGVWRFQTRTFEFY